MTETRWLRVEAIAIQVMESRAEDRRAVLDRACEGDAALRADVESLLAFETDAEAFLQQTALEEAARIVADDAPDTWQIDGYQVGELLGAGGMGDVYRAGDLRLERDVALKVIPVTGTDTSTSSFEDEARAASALNHPNIVTIYAVGNHDGAAYMVMELVRGRTLRDLLRDGALPVRQVLDIAVQFADGLAAAHHIGVVHRDLKPENLMVTPEGLLKILDFGIAKRERGFGTAAVTQPGGGTGTGRVSTFAGTAGYMSPEQARHTPADYRSDQFSFGAILYEMLVGRRAFGGETREETIEVVLRADSVSLGKDVGRVLPSLAPLITRCIDDSPDRRYPDTRNLAVDVRGVRDDVAGARPGLTRRQMVWLGGGALLSAATGTAWWRLHPAHRLAVLPFRNPEEDKDTEILCDGITEMLILQLGRINPATVIGRSSVFQLKGQANDPQEVGRRLDVYAVLDGEVVRRGDRASVKVELIDTRTGTRLWGDEFNRPDDVLAIQNEIAAAIITNGLGMELSQQQRRQLNRSLTGNAEAYRLFLMAIHYFRLDDEAGYRDARDLLSKAVALDSRFALAHLTLASTHSAGIVDGFEDPRTSWQLSHDHVTRALDADPDLPDARAERATEAFFRYRDWAAAQQEWKKALHAPKGEIQAELLTAYALQQWALGQADVALKSVRTARSIDPLSPMLTRREADLVAASGDLSSAADLYRRIIDETPVEQSRGASFGLAGVLRAQGRFDEAIQTLQQLYTSSDDSSLDDVFETARGAEGYRAIEGRLAEDELARLHERSSTGQYASPLDFARAYAMLGQTEQAFASLEEAFDHQAAGLVMLDVDPAWENIRRDSRFTGFVKRVRLPRHGETT